MSKATLTWYFFRLRSMTMIEIVHRIFEKARKTVSRHKHQGWSKYIGDGGTVVFHTVRGLTDIVDKLSLEQQKEIIVQADCVLSDGVKLLGESWPASKFTDECVDDLWSYDPVSGGHWGNWDSYTFDLNYRTRELLGDVKYVWEINRLQFLQPIAIAFYLTSDDRYLRFVDRIINSWFKENEPFRGLGWSSGIEVALRSISLLFVLSMTSSSLPVETYNRLQMMLRASEFWIKRFPSLYSSANNHRVAELAAQVLLSCARNDKPIEEHRRVIKELERCFLDQIYPDGAPAEQSPSYGAFTVEFLLLALIATRSFGEDFSDPVLARCASFSDFILAIMNEGGQVPHFGDNDEGRVLFSVSGYCDYSLEIADAASRIIRKERLADGPICSGVRNLFIVCQESSSRRKVTKKSIETFHDGGISILRSMHQILGPTELVFDHGPLGFLSIAAHGHADALSFVYSVGGKEIFVDPGTYLYHSGNQLRDWFRGTKAHNTLTLNSANQSTISGPFNWSTKALTRLIDTTTGADSVTVVGEHDGYKHHHGVLHRRSVALTSSGFLIEDNLIGESVERAEVNFQFARGWSLIDRRESSLFLSDGEVGLWLEGPIGSVVTSFKGTEDPPSCGMISDSFGSLSSALRVEFALVSPQRSLITRATLVTS